MRSLTETKQRWDETLRHGGGSLAALQRAVKFDGPSSPCEAGCRSVCWKVFLLFQDAPVEDRVLILREGRADYEALCSDYLQFIRRPELLAELTVDPLADDPESPWDTFRRDDVVRAEILQDVLRLPDDPFYHEERIQALILDVLFVYFKRNPDVGGYRQGMHELLAPIVYVLSQDAIDPASGTGDATDAAMAETLDAKYIEHDAYALFSKIMERAKSFYHISSSSEGANTTASNSLTNGPTLSRTLSSSAGGAEESAIVEMSKKIHDVTLMKIDPELAVHLRNIEVLPQIFLIRWIRLLFGREFPFDQLLVLWDGIFAFDPTLKLIPLICVAMLLRIRWEVLEADYSVALQLLLKYPSPQPPHGPHTFVDDAAFLQDHFNAAGGNSLVLKYTGRSPANVMSPRSSTDSHRPSTPTSAISAGLGSLRNRARISGRSPLASLSGRPSAGELAGLGRNTSTSPSRFAGGREGMEALFQGAAKGVMERGQRLGINQAVRDAVGEIRRNMAQGIQEARQAAKAAGRGAHGPAAAIPVSFDPFGPSGSLARRRTSSISQAVHALAEMEKRNRQLAVMLDEAVESLKTLAVAPASSRTSTDEPKDAAMEEGKEGNKSEVTPKPAEDAHWLDTVELAAAKVQFVKVHLEDATLELPSDEPAGAKTEEDTPMAASETAEDKSGSAEVASLLPAAEAGAARDEPVEPLMKAPAVVADPLSVPVKIPPTGNVLPVPPKASPAESSDDSRMDLDGADEATVADPLSAATETAPVPVPKQEHTLPTRSTLAQSSFAWMLEPGDTPENASGRGSLSTSPSNSGGGGIGSAGNGNHVSSSSSKRAPRASPAGRGRHAFLFGEVVGSSPLGNGDGAGDDDPLAPKKRGSQSGGGGSDGRARSITADEIFGLEPLRKALPKEK